MGWGLVPARVEQQHMVLGGLSAHRAHLENLRCRASAVGKRHIPELHLPIHVIRGQGPVVHHRGLAVDELEDLLSSSHSLHEAAVHGADGLEGKRQR